MFTLFVSRAAVPAAGTEPPTDRRRARRHQRNVLVCIAAAALAGGCDPGGVTLVEIGESPVTGGTLAVRVVDGEDAPVAGARVRHVRVRDYSHRHGEGTTDADGSYEIRGTDRGSLYWIAAEAGDAEHGIVAGGTHVRIGPGVEEVTIMLQPPVRSPVVISEVWMNGPDVWETGNQNYEASKFIEVANNSDAPVYLDGMLIGKGYSRWHEYSWHTFCADTGVMRVDPDGVWSHTMWRFPGAGTDYPLAPGEAAVIAVSAADHRDVHPSLLDLSGARFEFFTAGGADNPAAGNMVNVGPWSPSTIEHEFSWGNMHWFVARPGDVASFPEMHNPGASSGVMNYRRVPAELLLDVAVIFFDNTGEYMPIPPRPICDEVVHRSFDAVPGGFFPRQPITASAQRRRVEVNGERFLLDTNVSLIDFKMAERRSRTLP